MTSPGSTPTAMDVAVLSGPHNLGFETRPVPAPAAGELLVEVGVVGICGSDLHYWHEARSGSSTIEDPFVMGHEFGGTIRAVGFGVDPNRVGERVAVEPGVPCGSCDSCVTGRYNHCSSMHFYGAAPIDGALQRFICVAADNAFALPSSVSDTAAAMLEPLSVALWASERAQLDDARSVLVIGAGPVGLLVADVAALGGLERLIVVDTNEHRLEVAAQRTGAQTFTPAVWQQQLNNTVEVVMECSGAATAVPLATAAVQASGRIVVVGVGPKDLTLQMNLIQEDEVTVTGSHRYRHTWPRAIKLAASGAVDLERLVTSRFGLDQLVDALENNQRDPRAIKTVVDVGGHPQTDRNAQG